MIGFLKEVHQGLLHHLLLRSHNKMIQLFVQLFYIYSGLLFIYFSMNDSLGRSLFVLIFYFGMIYVSWFVIHLTFVLVQRVIFRDIDKLCQKIELMFKPESKYYDHHTYLEHEAAFKTSDIVKEDKVPHTKLLSLWAYNLNAKKPIITLLLPFLVVWYFVVYQNPMLQVFIGNIAGEHFGGFDYQYLKWSLEAFTYPYIFFIYYLNMSRIDKCLRKITLLKELKS
ncbi:hypothetical protein [Caldalkalibacillus salinus]|uniref:hypothetical protein n=1 Tax=Caldalkalibacillus salinus TaxID=2803787 RepID=UPI00192078B1|nr:hypothetical protein [Caldalkalibacillus salinus]